MYKFKTKLLYNEEKHFCTKTEWLNFKFNLPLAKLDIVGSSLIFSHDIPIDIQSVTFSLLSNIRELSTKAKTRKTSLPT